MLSGVLNCLIAASLLYQFVVCDADSNEIATQNLHQGEKGELFLPLPAHIFSGTGASNEEKINTVEIKEILSSNPIIKGFAMFEADRERNLTFDPGTTVGSIFGTSESSNVTSITPRPKMNSTNLVTLNFQSKNATVPYQDDNFNANYKSINETFFEQGFIRITQAAQTDRSEVEPKQTGRNLADKKGFERSDRLMTNLKENYTLDEKVNGSDKLTFISPIVDNINQSVSVNETFAKSSTMNGMSTEENKRNSNVSETIDESNEVTSGVPFIVTESAFDVTKYTKAGGNEVFTSKYYSGEGMTVEEEVSESLTTQTEKLKTDSLTSNIKKDSSGTMEQSSLSTFLLTPEQTQGTVIVTDSIYTNTDGPTEDSLLHGEQGESTNIEEELQLTESDQQINTTPIAEYSDITKDQNHHNSESFIDPETVQTIDQSYHDEYNIKFETTPRLEVENENRYDISEFQQSLGHNSDPFSSRSAFVDNIPSPQSMDTFSYDEHSNTQHSIIPIGIQADIIPRRDIDNSKRINNEGNGDQSVNIRNRNFPMKLFGREELILPVIDPNFHAKVEEKEDFQVETLTEDRKRNLLGNSISIDENSEGYFVARPPLQQKGGTLFKSNPLSFREKYYQEKKDSKFYEEQKMVVGGKPTILKLWNPLLYGHNLLKAPGSFVNADLHILQESKYYPTKDSRKKYIRYKNRNNRVTGAKTHYNNNIERKENRPPFDNERSKTILLLPNLYALNGSPFDQSQVNSEEGLSPCFIVKKNRMLSNASPFKRQIGADLVDCARFCLSEERCTSAIFSSRMSACDIYNIINGTIKGNSIKLLRLPHHYYLKKKPNKYVDCLNEIDLYKIEKNNGLPDMSDETEKTTSVNRVIIKLGLKHQPQLESEQTEISDTMELVKPQIENLHDRKYSEKKHFKGMTCSGENVIFLKTIGWPFMRISDDDVEFISSESQCVKSCIHNSVPSYISFLCATAQYDARSHRCLLSRYFRRTEVIETNSDDKSVHYEKLCIPSKIAKFCSTSIIERQPQRILLSYINSLVTSSSLQDCVQKCLIAHSYGSIDCHSLIYLYQDERENCLLYSATRRKYSEAFITETETLVDYVGLDDCFPKFQSSIGRLKLRRDQTLPLSPNGTNANLTGKLHAESGYYLRASIAR